MYSKTLANFLLKFKQSFQFQLDRGFGPLIPLGLCPQTQLEACTSALVMLFQPSNPGYAYETWLTYYATLDLHYNTAPNDTVCDTM